MDDNGDPLTPASAAYAGPSGPSCPECGEECLWDEGDYGDRNQPQIFGAWHCPMCGIDVDGPMPEVDPEQA